MIGNEAAIEYLVVSGGVAFAINRVLKRVYPERSHMFLVDFFLGAMATTLLGFVFPELISWAHFSISDYRDDPPGG
jgi:hypothetical protein